MCAVLDGPVGLSDPTAANWKLNRIGFCVCSLFFLTFPFARLPCYLTYSDELFFYERNTLTQGQLTQTGRMQDAGW